MERAVLNAPMNAVAWTGYGMSMLLLRPVARADTHELLSPVALGGFALAWTVGFIAAGVLLSRIVHTVSDGAWAFVGIGLQAPQLPESADDPQPVPR
jgi:hypothetical protein